jgi:hypothetical protein
VGELGRDGVFAGIPNLLSVEDQRFVVGEIEAMGFRAMKGGKS